MLFHAAAWTGTYSNWQGMAPAAKIAFQDLGTGNTGTLSVPYDLFYDYYPYSYQWCSPVAGRMTGVVNSVECCLCFAWSEEAARVRRAYVSLHL
jgi:hypothetical protein